MMEIYVLVARNKSIAMRLLATFFFAVTVVLLLFGCVNMFLLPFAIIAGFLWYLLQFQSNKEFEYSYFDGDVRFAKVMNKSRRKSLGSYTMEEVLQIAPAGNRAMYKFENDSTVKKLDYTSGNKETLYYEMVVNDESGTKLIMFEPDDQYLDAVCVKYSQKVVRA
jgi:hypothetical protein